MLIWVRLLSIIILVLSFQNCGNFASNSDTLESLNLEQSDNSETIALGKNLYGQQCAGCHGSIDISSKIGRNTEQIIWAIGNVPQMQQLNSLTENQISAIASALIFEQDGGGVEISEQGRLQFTCNPALQSKTPLLKLTTREYRNSLFAVLDTISSNLKNDSTLNQLINAIPTDSVLVKGNKRKEQSMLITQTLSSGYFEASFHASLLVANANLQNYPGTNSCLAQTSISENCHRLFVQELGSSAFRRRLAIQESQALAQIFWDSSLTKQQQIQMTFTGITQMPDFLYKAFDQGQIVEGSNRILQLTTEEIAAKLSYFLTGSPPDSQLRQLATNGSLSDPTILSQQIDRLLATTQARDMIQRFFRESLGYENFGTFNYPTFFSSGINTSGLQEAMVRELDQFFVNETLNNNATFLDLLTSRRANIDHNGLASIYNVSVGNNQTLPVERSGFLNRAALLTKRSGVRASPIKRGLAVLENTLCIDVGSPPPSAPTALPDFGNEIVTTRDATHRTSEISGSSCITCHSRINPLGYAFENFDSLGRLRTMERVFDVSLNEIASLPIDTQDQTNELGPQPINFNHSTQLSSQIGSSDKGMMCLTKHLKEFESRTETGLSDYCQMNNALNGIYGNGTNQGPIVQAIKNLILSEQFKRWSF